MEEIHVLKPLGVGIGVRDDPLSTRQVVAVPILFGIDEAAVAIGAIAKQVKAGRRIAPRPRKQVLFVSPNEVGCNTVVVYNAELASIRIGRHHSRKPSGRIWLSPAVQEHKSCSCRIDKQVIKPVLCVEKSSRGNGMAAT